jgi:hypothetical protein
MANQTVEILISARNFKRSFFGRKVMLHMGPPNSDSKTASDIDSRQWPAQPLDPARRQTQPS